MKRVLLIGFILFPLLSYAQDEDTSCLCEAPSPQQDEIKQANPNNIQSLLERYPNDFWVQRKFIELKSGNSYLLRQSPGIPSSRVDESIVAKFRESYERQPSSKQAAYLYAYSLIHTDTAESIKLLTGIVHEDPPLPVAWMTLGILHGYSEFGDQTKQKAYLEAFLERCPETVEPRVATLALQLDPSDILKTYMKNLRKRIEGKKDADLLPLFNYLWMLEMRSAAGGGEEEAKKRIKKDLAFIEQLDWNEFTIAQSLLTRGYSQIGDTSGLQELSQRHPQLASSSNSVLFTLARTEWSRENPVPPPTASLDEHRDYLRRQVKFLDEWQEKQPDNMSLLDSLFSALACLPESSDETLISVGERILSQARRAPTGPYTTPAMKVLQTWADRDILLERIPSIVEQLPTSQTSASILSILRIQSDISATSSGLASSLEENRKWEAETGAWSALLSVYAKTGKFDQANEILAEWEEGLEIRRKKVEEIRTRQMGRLRNAQSGDSAARPNNVINLMESVMVRQLPNDEAKYYEAFAKLAIGEGRNLDALAYYQVSLRFLNETTVNQMAIMDRERVKDAAGSIWKALDGSEAGWEVWNKSVRGGSLLQPPSVPRQVVVKKQLPEFSLPDQHGETWTLAGLKGKTTLINVWATWCGPCRNELPHLQKLYEQIKDRSDIQVITLNIDEDRGKVEPFLKENDYSFPSLYANSYVKDFAGALGIPTSWTVDRSGTIRSESLGFSGNGTQWVEQHLKDLEDLDERAE